MSPATPPAPQPHAAVNEAPQSHFERVMAFVLKWEGGYVNHPRDPGGATNLGVTQATYDAYRKNLSLAPRSVRLLTRPEALAIYRSRYWDAIGGDARPYPEALAVMDFAVNSGVSRALDYWRKHPDVLDYLDARQEFLTGLSTFGTFGRGWMRRLNALRRELNSEPVRLDTGLVQVFANGKTLEFTPAAASVGRTSSGQRKLMVRV